MSLLDLLRTLPAPELAGAARALPDEDLAAIVRELPDFRLGQLVAGAAGVAQRDIKPAKAKPTRALRKELAQRKKAAAAPEVKGHEARSAAARERADGIVAWLEKHGTSAGPQIAKALGFNAVTLQGYLRRLVAEGRVERSGGKSGPGVRYSPVGRQTSPRKAKPAKAAEADDEGAGVKLSVAAPVPGTRPRVAATICGDVAEEPSVSERWRPTPVLHNEPNVPALLAPPVEPEEVRAATDRIRCLPYRSTITASACLERQRVAGAHASRRTGPGSGRLTGAEVTARINRGEYSKCVGCDIGACVRGRLTS